MISCTTFYPANNSVTVSPKDFMNEFWFTSKAFGLACFATDYSSMTLKILKLGMQLKKGSCSCSRAFSVARASEGAVASHDDEIEPAILAILDANAPRELRARKPYRGSFKFDVFEKCLIIQMQLHFCNLFALSRENTF